MSALAQPSAPTPTPQPQAVPAGIRAANVGIITIDREIDAVMAKSVRRRIKEFEKEKADALVFELNTPGGNVGAVLEICTDIKQCGISNTVGWVNTDAVSGGALIALACRETVVSPSASMGDALSIAVHPVLGYQQRDEQLIQKAMAPVLGEVVHSARLRGHDERLVQGMVSRGVDLYLIENVHDGRKLFVGSHEYREIFGQDPPSSGQPMIPAAAGAATIPQPESSVQQPSPGSTEVVPAIPNLPVTVIDDVNLKQDRPSTRPVLTPADKDDWRFVEYVSDGTGVVLLRTPELVRYGLASSIVKDEAELKQHFGATSTATLHQSWSESLVVALTNWVVRGVLIVVFLLGLFIEMVHPGLILPGTIAFLALIALIAPPALNDMASWWEIAAILVGILALALEMFVVPGFGVFGVLGLLLLFGGLLGTFVTGSSRMFPGAGSGSSDLTRGATILLLSGLTSGVLMYLAAKHFGSIPLLNRLVLNTGTDESEEGLLSAMAEPDRPIRAGDEGVALTPLRPAGRVQVGDSIYDVVAELGFIPSGATVKVSKVEDFRISVELSGDDSIPRAQGPLGDGGGGAGGVG
ncbi:MAG: ATP-dependent Clp protease proteolytic subunit, partial [Phycisphaerales bacterium]|nr:ATP-dependent Clp protease proteolytic subunit [Phycisphaerales bacterium]